MLVKHAGASASMDSRIEDAEGTCIGIASKADLA
jgi:hypothetical protein